MNKSVMNTKRIILRAIILMICVTFIQCKDKKKDEEDNCPEGSDLLKNLTVSRRSILARAITNKAIRRAIDAASVWEIKLFNSLRARL